MASEMRVRNVGVDLAKCLAILFVIMHHIGDCGIRIDSSFTLGVVKSFFHSFSFCCINLFAIISGFLGGGKLKLQLSRMTSLWLQAVFIGIVGLCVIRFVFGYNVLYTHWMQVILPITRGAYWYLSAFSLLFFLSPILNFAINGLGKRTLMVMFIFIFAICSLSSPWFKNEYNGFGMGLIDGYSTIWLLIMYFAGGYIGKYKKDMPSMRVCALVVMIGAFLSTVLFVVVWAKIPILSTIAFRGGMVGGYRNPLIVVLSISMFMLCVQSQFSNGFIRQCLKWGASASFGIYLIHVHPYVWRYIWVPKLNSIHVHSLAEWLAWVLGGTLLVFFSCGALESLRVLIFRFLRINRLASMADRITINE